MSISKRSANRSCPGLFPAICICTLAALAACNPYPDDGEFLAGAVFGGHFVPGVLAPAKGGTGFALLPAVGQNKWAVVLSPYTVIATTGSGPTSPLWTDGKTRTDPTALTYYDPASKSLLPQTQVTFVFDGTCTPPDGYVPSEPLDLIAMDQQYPIFQDIPEVLTTNNGRVGRTGTYNAIVEVRHISLPSGFPCQSIKRFDTVMARTDLNPMPAAVKEYRLLQVFDPGLTMPPLPYQLGFFNQLVVPYLDMGPVPVAADGQHFQTMPIYDVLDQKGNPIFPQVGPDGTPDPTVDNMVVPGPADMMAMGAPAYSPICAGYSLTADPQSPPPPDVTNAAYKAAKPTGSLSACLVCRTKDLTGTLDCPFAGSGGGKR